MVLKCLTWILHLFKKIMGDPDDANGVEDLSTTFLGQGNRINKKWRMLTSLSNYREHRSRDRQLILRYFGGHNGSRISIIDGKSEKECKARELKALSFARIVNCHNGLILLTSTYPVHQHIVLNPLSNKIMTRISPLFWGGYPCGLFFHPLAKEYRILNVQKIMPNHYEYHLYLFGTKTWRKTVNPYFNLGPPDCEDSKQVFSCNPAITNGALHWFMGKIMIFDMISEEFCVKLPPSSGCYRKEAYWLPDLLVNEDHLCCCFMPYPEPVMDIWILEDYEKWSWTRKYIVNLDWDTIKYPLKVGFVVAPYILTHVRAVSIQKDELVLFWNYRGMFSYHLGFNTIEKINLRKSEDMDYYVSIKYDSSCGFMAYTATTIDF